MTDLVSYASPVDTTIGEMQRLDSSVRAAVEAKLRSRQHAIFRIG